MSNLENQRAQRDAQRSTRRSSGSSAPEQAIIRHLSVEFYRERRQADRTPQTSGRTEAGEKRGDEKTTDGSDDR